MKEQAGLLVRSGFLPQTIKTSEQAIAVMLKGRELRIPPMEALSQLYVVQGKVTLQSQLMLALIRRSGRYGYRVAKTTPLECVFELWPYAHPEEKYCSTFTIKEAIAADLTKNPVWRKYPAQMLRARAISAAARVVCPEIIGGLYTPEEMGAPVTVDAEGEIQVIEGHAEDLEEVAETRPVPDEDPGLPDEPEPHPEEDPFADSATGNGAGQPLLPPEPGEPASAAPPSPEVQAAAEQEELDPETARAMLIDSLLQEDPSADEERAVSSPGRLTTVLFKMGLGGKQAQDDLVAQLFPEETVASLDADGLKCVYRLARRRAGK